MEVTQAGPTKPTFELRQATYVGPIHYLKGSPSHVLLASGGKVLRAKIFGPMARTRATEWNLYNADDFEIGELLLEDSRNPCTEL